jgi:uncharacterized protein
MWSRADFERRFGRRAVIGMVHLAPLPGAPLYGGAMQEVIDSAVRDAEAIAAGGGDAVMIENFGDRPFRKERADPETVSAMSVIAAEVSRAVKIPFGVNVLRNDGLSALAIAAATGASFIRVNVLVGAMLADQGVLEGDAASITRRRSELRLEQVGIFGDYLVKHAAPLADYHPLQLARDLRHRGLADVIVVSGRETGDAADTGRLEMVRGATDAPIVIGSGLTAQNAANYAPLSDGAIVGTALKVGGSVDARVDRGRVAAVVESFKRA